MESAHTLIHDKAIWCVKFSPDGRHLVTACNDGKARIYDVKTGSIVRQVFPSLFLRNTTDTVYSVLTDLLTKDPWIRSLCFSPDGNYLATGSNDSLIRVRFSFLFSCVLINSSLQVWKVATKYVKNAFKGHKKRITSLEFSSNGKTLISASRDNSVRLWNMHDGAVKVFTYEGSDLDTESSFYSATLSPNGMHIAAGHSDGAIRIWDLLTGKLVQKLVAHSPWVACVAFMPDGKGLVSGGRDASMKYWDLSPLEIFRPNEKRSRWVQRNSGFGDEIQPRVTQEFSGHTVRVFSVARSLQ